MQHFLSDALCISRSYLHDNLPERPTLSWLDRNLTWPTADQCHSKLFPPFKSLSVSLPIGGWELQAPTIFDQTLTRVNIFTSDTCKTLGILSGLRIQTQDFWWKLVPYFSEWSRQPYSRSTITYKNFGVAIVTLWGFAIATPYPTVKGST